MHSMKFAAIQPGETVAVFGAGPIGLLTIACLKVAGAGRIWAVEPVAHRREMALQHGRRRGARSGASRRGRAQIMTDTGKRGVDCAIDCAAKEHTTNQAIRAARNAGRVVLTGIHSACWCRSRSRPCGARNWRFSMCAARITNRDAALDLLVDRTAWFAPLVTHTRPLERIAEAFRLTGNYADGVGKMVIRASA